MSSSQKGKENSCRLILIDKLHLQLLILQASRLTVAQRDCESEVDDGEAHQPPKSGYLVRQMIMKTVYRNKRGLLHSGNFYNGWM